MVKDSVNWRDTPIFIPNRNNLERGFRRLVEWLEAAGMSRIVIVDCGSSYPPLLDYYRQRTTSAGNRPPLSRKPEVHFAFRNLGPGAPWALRLEQLGTRFIVSDPDVVPAPECPRDLIERLHHMADYYDGAKVGPALRIDNLPESYARKAEVLAWEKQFWLKPVQGNCFLAPIDTTFALYAPGSCRWPREPHFRLAPPYVIEHAPWYEDSAAANPEREFYQRAAEQEWSHW